MTVWKKCERRLTRPWNPDKLSGTQLRVSVGHLPMFEIAILQLAGSRMLLLGTRAGRTIQSRLCINIIRNALGQDDGNVAPPDC